MVRSAAVYILFQRQGYIQEFHRRTISMQIHSIAVNLGKTTFRTIALENFGQDADQDKVLIVAAAGVHGEHANFADQLGGGSSGARFSVECCRSKAIQRGRPPRSSTAKTCTSCRSGKTQASDFVVSRRTAVVNQIRALSPGAWRESLHRRPPSEGCYS